MALRRPAEGHEHRSSGVNSQSDQISSSPLRAAFHLAVLAALAGAVISLAKPAGPSAHDHDPDPDSDSDQNPDSAGEVLP